MALTGIKDIDMKIIDNLNDEELGKVCSVNKYVSTLCNDEIFWINRIRRIYLVNGEELKQMKEYLLFRSYKKLYIWLQQEFLTSHRDRFRFPINFDQFKNNLRYNDAIEKELWSFLKERTIPTWIDKKEFLIHFKRVLFKTFGGEIYLDDIMDKLLPKNFYINLNEILVTLNDTIFSRESQ